MYISLVGSSFARPGGLSASNEDLVINTVISRAVSQMLPAPRLGAAGFVVLMVMLSGCTTTGTTPGASNRIHGPDGAATQAEAVTEVPREFAKDELYRLLVAEFAAKRGDLATTVRHYLAVARSTQDIGVAERAVRYAMYAGDQPGSLEAARVWTEIAPEDPQARQVLGALLMRSGQLEEAVSQFESIVKNQGTEEGFDSVSELLSRERDKQTAMQTMGKLLTGHETNPHALYAYAVLSARAGRIDKAIELLEQLLTIDPDHERGAVFYGRLLQQAGNVTQALDTLARTLDKNPDSQTVRMTYAGLLVDTKHYGDARAQFEKLIEQAPENSDVRYALGLLLLQTNHPEDARTHFEFLANVPERKFIANYYLGKIAETTEDLEAAIKAYRKVDHGEYYLNAQIRVAVIYAKQGDLNRAQEYLQSLPRQNLQQDIRIYRAEAEILTRNEQLGEAMSVYDRALEEHQDNADLLYARAMLAEKVDRLDVLERDLRAILSQEPDNANAMNALGFTLADRTDRFDEAFELLARAIELKPDDYYIIDSMGWVLYRVGRHEEALEYLQRALSLSDDPEVAAHLGEVLWVMGRKSAAREVWDTALKIRPDDELLLEVIKRFSN